MNIDRNKIRFVDGFKIRNFLDIEFGVMHGSGTEITEVQFRNYIPEGEWWVDHSHKEELDFLIKTEEFYWEWPDHITTFNEFREYEKEKLCLPPPIPNYILSTRTINDRKVVLVDGKIIRQYIDPEFVIGGHNFVYNFVPLGEIWIDAVMNESELPYFLAHEGYEYDLMQEGMIYDSAHDHASAKEKEFRRSLEGSSYPLDSDYRFRGLKNSDLIKNFYTHEKPTD